MAEGLREAVRGLWLARLASMCNAICHLVTHWITHWIPSLRTSMPILHRRLSARIASRMKVAPVLPNRIGHDSGVVSATGISRTARSFQLLQASLQEALERQGILGLSASGAHEVRDVLFVEEGWARRFLMWKGEQWSPAKALEHLGPDLLRAIKRLAAAMLSSVQAAQGVHVPPLVLAAVQVSAMLPRSERGPHYDNPSHGDLVVSLTVSGEGIVFLGACAAEPQGITHERGGTWYALSKRGLSDYKHAVSTVNQPRLSITYRYVKPGT